MTPLAGRRALVTGANHGIGRAIALELAAQGADICVHHLGDRDAALETCDDIGALGRKAVRAEADFLSEAAVAALPAQAREGLSGSIDILILNAAIQLRAPVEEITAEAGDAQFRANIVSSITLIQALAPSMALARFGRIVSIGSVQQWRPHPQMLVYAGLKRAMENMVENLARQWAADGITVNTVAPGVIETDRNAQALSVPRTRAEVLQGIPMGRLGRAAECAGIVAALCGPAGDYITGATIPVDGGMRLA